MKGVKVLALALCGHLAAFLLVRLSLDGLGASDIAKGLFVLASCAAIAVSVVRSSKWPSLIGLGALLVLGALVLDVYDLTDPYAMLLGAGLFCAPALVLAYLLMLSGPGKDPGLAEAFKIRLFELGHHYVALGIVCAIAVLLIAGMVILWNVPAIRFYLSGQSYAFVQALLFCSLSLLLTTPLLGTFRARLGR